MRGLWLERGLVRLRDDIPTPKPRRGEALVRVLQAGICDTDLALIDGYHPFTGVLGHEFVGIVESGPESLAGKRVVGEINCACGECRACAASLPRHCIRREALGIRGRDGAFAEYLALPIENVHEVPDGVSDATATFVEPLAAALRIQQQVRIGDTDRALVVGDGKLGQLIARTLLLTGCHLVVAGRHPDKLAKLAEAGITTATAGELEPRAFDVAVECTGNAEGFDLARRALRPTGTLVLKSTYPGRLELDAPSLVVDELNVIGSRCGPFPPALALLADGALQVEALVDARYSLADGIDALDRAAAPGVLKVLLTIGETDPARDPSASA